MKKYKHESQIAIGDKFFAFDLTKLSEAITSDNGDDEKTQETDTTEMIGGDGTLEGKSVVTREFDKGIIIDGPKYDVIRMCFEVLLTYMDDIDDSLGIDRALNGTSIPFKLAFNTLLTYGILNEIKINK
jgi:hypothetical protein